MTPTLKRFCDINIPTVYDPFLFLSHHIATATAAKMPHTATALTGTHSLGLAARKQRRWRIHAIVPGDHFTFLTDPPYLLSLPH
jgi:hypothetical protein